MLGLVGLSIGIYHSALLEPHHHHKASNQPIISLKLIHHFDLQHPPHKHQVDPWDVKQLLSLLESWIQVSSLTNFKLVSKTDFFSSHYGKTYLWFKHCYIFIIRSFFFNIMLLFLFLSLVVKWIDLVIFLDKFILNHIPVLLFVLYCIGRLISRVLSLSGRSWMDLRYPLCFLAILGNICQCVPNFVMDKESFNDC